MAFEQKDMTGSVFKNERKTTDNHPDRTGSATIDGVAYWVNGWMKQDKNGNPWLSLAFKRKDQPGSALPAARTNGQSVLPRREVEDSEIPF